jgi:hypothetical protein
MGLQSASRRRRLLFGLACGVAWLWMPGVSHAQTATETCPASASPPAPPLARSISTLQPSTQQILACVGSQAIDGALFRHWATIAERAEPRAQRHSAGDVHALIDEVMGFLISSDWVIGEANDLNVRVSPAQVRRRLDRIRHEQYPKRREFKAFLRSSGQTVADVLLRVRLNILSERIQRQVLTDVHGAKAREEALTRFVKEFKSKWGAQTYCSPQYTISDCGHVQAVL